MKLSEFVASLRKRCKDVVLVKSKLGYDKSVHFKIEGQPVGWACVDFDQDGNFNVTSLMIRDDMNVSRHLEVIASVACLKISTTNQKEIDRNENASV